MASRIGMLFTWGRPDASCWILDVSESIREIDPEKAMRNNSSFGLAVFRNSETAARAFFILFGQPFYRDFDLSVWNRS